MTSNLYFAIICRCRTAIPLHNSFIYYQATNNMIVFIVIAPASATGTKGQQEWNMEKEDEYDVKKILDEKKVKGKTQYLVKWPGYEKEGTS